MRQHFNINCTYSCSRPGPSQWMQNLALNSYCQMSSPNVIMTTKSNNTVALYYDNGHVMESNTSSRLVTGCGNPSLYLVHVSVCATSHPLDELKVILRVPPLDLGVWPGKDIHGSLNQTILYI